LGEREVQKKNPVEINPKRLGDRFVGKVNLIALKVEDLEEIKKGEAQ
jgi:hypothetical protein